MWKLILLVWVIFEAAGEDIIVHTKSGTVIGNVAVFNNETIYNSFKSIPYAEPPIGDLRFEPPVPVKPWNDTYNATKSQLSCPQITDDDKVYIGQENCLVLDIFSPKNATSGDKIPSFVVFFGGIFKFGNTSKFGPQFFMSKQIIFIAVSFRLGVLGLFSTGDTLVPGNMAFKDQSLALTWIKHNIEAFGGDPDRIALLGHSSGATSVHLHTLSPLSKGLFRRAIMMSGVANGMHLFHSKDTAKNLSQLFSSRVGCGKNLTSDTVSCLKQKSAKELVTEANKLFVWRNYMPLTVFRPTIEDKNVKNAFLTDLPLFASHPSTDVEFLMGMTTGEGAQITNQLFANLEGLDIDPNLSFPLYAYNFWHTKPSHLNFASQMMKAHFFGDQEVGGDTDRLFVALLNGILYGRGLMDAVDKFNGTKYVYVFDYHLNYTNQIGNGLYSKYLGIAHADDVSLMFYYSDVIMSTFTKMDMRIGQEIITRWINFAYSGNPNEGPGIIDTQLFSRWEPVKTYNLEFLYINLNGSMRSGILRDSLRFWQKLPVYSNYF